MYPIIIAAMEVKFGENDYIVNENDESLTVPIIASQDIQENVTIELIPMTLYQFSATGTSLPDNAANQDPAEAGMYLKRVSMVEPLYSNPLK